MAKLKKGQRLVCVPCGREIVLSTIGISSTTIWCCGKPMKRKTKARPKKKVSRN
jgi:hypothetical protein